MAGRQPKWECSDCTLMNDAWRKRCSVCKKEKDRVSYHEELTVVIIGNSERAKTELGNLLLKNKVFEDKNTHCEVGYVVQSDHEILKVVKTGRMFDRGMEEIEVTRELTRFLYKTSPGPHVFLFAVDDQDPHVDQDYLGIFLGLFGEEMLQRTVLVQMTTSTSCSEFDENVKFANCLVLHVHGSAHAQTSPELEDNEIANQDAVVQYIVSVVVANKCTCLSNDLFRQVRETIKSRSVSHLECDEKYREIKHKIRSLESKSEKDTMKMEQLERELRHCRKRVEELEKRAHQREQNRFLDNKTLDAIFNGLKMLGEHLFQFGINYAMKRLTL